MAESTITLRVMCPHHKPANDVGYRDLNDAKDFTLADHVGWLLFGAALGSSVPSIAAHVAYYPIGAAWDCDAR